MDRDTIIWYKVPNQVEDSLEHEAIDGFTYKGS